MVGDEHVSQDNPRVCGRPRGRYAPGFIPVDLSTYARELRIREYAEIVSLSETTVLRQLRADRCDVPPVSTAPYRWRRIDVQRFVGSPPGRDTMTPRLIRQAVRQRQGDEEDPPT